MFYIFYWLLHKLTPLIWFEIFKTFSYLHVKWKISNTSMIFYMAFDKKHVENEIIRSTWDNYVRNNGTVWGFRMILDVKVWLFQKRYILSFRVCVLVFFFIRNAVGSILMINSHKLLFRENKTSIFQDYFQILQKCCSSYSVQYCYWMIYVLKCAPRVCNSLVHCVYLVNLSDTVILIIIYGSILVRNVWRLMR